MWIKGIDVIVNIETGGVVSAKRRLKGTAIVLSLGGADIQIAYIAESPTTAQAATTALELIWSSIESGKLGLDLAGLGSKLPQDQVSFV